MADNCLWSTVGEDQKQGAGAESQIERLQAFAEVAMAPGEGGVSGLLLLVRTLQACLAASETFPVDYNPMAVGESPYPKS